MATTTTKLNTEQQTTTELQKAVEQRDKEIGVNILVTQLLV